MKHKGNKKGRSVQRKLTIKKPVEIISMEEARKFLSNVRPENSFWINNGPIINNLKHLPKAVEEIDEMTFMHHVTIDKNDFSKWIEECIGDTKLANDLRKARTKDDFLKKLKNRVNFLKKIVYAEA